MAGNRFLGAAGTFCGVGVGPGDSELLTLKAVKAIENADVIIAPKTEKKEGSVALSVAEPYIKKDAQIIFQVFPMVKNFAESKTAWRQNKNEIVSFLQAGKNTVFLTIGDPFFYSTYIYVYRMLKDDGVPVVTVPGITAFSAVASAFGRPVVEGNEVLAIIPATASAEKINRALNIADSAVLMKVYRNAPEIAAMLAQHGMTDDALMVSRCGLDDEEVIDISSLEKNSGINYLSTILAHRRENAES